MYCNVVARGERDQGTGYVMLLLTRTRCLKWCNNLVPGVEYNLNSKLYILEKIFTPGVYLGP